MLPIDEGHCIHLVVYPIHVRQNVSDRQLALCAQELGVRTSTAREEALYLSSLEHFHSQLSVTKLVAFTSLSVSSSLVGQIRQYLG